MAVYKLFPTSDATIYSAYPDMNTGLDEILEASTDTQVTDSQNVTPYPQASRFLLKFNPVEISDIFTNRIKTSNWQANLRCYVANVTGIYNTTTLAVNALAEDWSMGPGKFGDVPQTQNGVSWTWKNYSGSNAWTTASYTVGTTGSFDIVNNPYSAGGGVWYTGSQASQSLEYYSTLDLNFNITRIVHLWNSASISNYGVIVRQTQSQEFVADPNLASTLKYFSRDTHTIYPPCLELKWDDSTYNTGTLATLSTLPATTVVDNNSGVFYPESINTFRVNARPTYPVRVWQTASVYTDNYALPTASYYAVKDVDTDEYVIDFDTTYTKLSCDSTGNYFTLYMNGLEPERYYKILIQSTIGTSTVVFDEECYFKIVNG